MMINLRYVCFDELKLFIALWDIQWCLGGDFNVVRSPVKSSSGGRLSSAMLEFSNFINSSGLIDPPLEGGRYIWSSHEDVPILSRINRFLFFVDWEDHFQGVRQVILPQITSDHFPIPLLMGSTMVAKRPFKFENVWLEVDNFFDFVKAVWYDFNVYDSSSCVFAKKLNFLKSTLREWNRDVFGHLDAKPRALINKIKVFVVKGKLHSLSRAERLARLEVKKELSLVHKWLDTFWRQQAKQQWILEGDRHTKFFHRVANFRRKFNVIQSIRVDGLCLDDSSSMKGAIVNF